MRISAVRRLLEHLGPLTALGLLGAAGWAFVAWMTLDMAHPWVMLMMPTDAAWQPATIAAVIVMWSMMMVAMMLPSAAPMITTFHALLRGKQDRDAASWRTGAFVGGYLAAWIAFSLAAAALQWWLQSLHLVNPMVEATSPLVASGLLIGAGLYQLSPLKHMCLRLCRSPIGFLLMEWRPGVVGAWAMGLKHGSYCVGCCWALMLLLFVAGAMNLAWIVLLAVVVAAEKLSPPTRWLTSAIGVALLLTGVVLPILASGGRGGP